jgi:hypothetical protein
MNKFYFLKCAAIVILFAAGNGFAQQSNTPPQFTAADYARAEKMLSYNVAPLVDRAGIRPNWLADNRFWYRSTSAAGSEFVLINAADGSRQVFSDQAKLNAAVGAAMAPAAGNQNRNPNESLSPDGKRAAFIRDWNLWMRDVVSGKETQLTTDGIKISVMRPTTPVGRTATARFDVVAGFQKDCDVSARPAQDGRDVSGFDASRSSEARNLEISAAGR